MKVVKIFRNDLFLPGQGFFEAKLGCRELKVFWKVGEEPNDVFCINIGIVQKNNGKGKKLYNYFDCVGGLVKEGVLVLVRDDIIDFILAFNGTRL